MIEKQSSIACARIGLAMLDGQDVVLCATSRLARELRHEYDRLQQAAGLTRWATLAVPTVAQWLSARLDEAALMGRIPISGQAPLPLGNLQERILWHRIIESSTQGDAVSVLFDQAGMAKMAAEANALAVAWPLRLPPETGMSGGEGSEEVRHFLQWRKAFRQCCASSGWLEEVRYLDWQLDRLAEGVVEPGRLPRRIAFAGFDRYKPQEERLAGILRSMGIEVFELEQGRALSEATAVSVRALTDRRAECQAAVAWVKQQWAKNPQARLGIVVPELADLRAFLADRLDDELAPHTLSPARAGAARVYNFTLGTPLSGQPLVAAALRFLGLLVRPDCVTQEAFGRLLRDPGWSDWPGEADARAMMEAAMRRHLPASFSLAQAVSFIRTRSTQLENLLKHLSAAQEYQRSLARTQSLPECAENLRHLLNLGGWPGSRPLSSHEYQAQRALEAAFVQLAELGRVLGNIGMSAALGHLSQICHEQIFQPQTEGEPALQVMGLLESCGTTMDALWVMGMNDHLWPPAARPNPLLPALAQREARTPNASADVQAEFAATVQRRLLRSASGLVFSFAKSEGDRELRPSPLIFPWLKPVSEFPAEAAKAKEAEAEAGTPAPDSLLSRLVSFEDGRFERFIDRHAPPVGENEHLHGGTSLLKTQAICPAWAFYRFRLGAQTLATPVEGLDDAKRGTLLHRAMQCFWQTHGEAGLSGLKAMGEAVLSENIRRAVDEAIALMSAENDLAFPPRFINIEAERLGALLGEWLAVERARTANFTVLACEQENKLSIEGIGIRLFIDRIDRLDSGERVILDYKTGSQVSYQTWADARILEPQLPIYAAFTAFSALPEADSGSDQKSAPDSGDRIAAVVFGHVRREACKFVGIAEAEGLLPGVAGIAEEEARKVFEAMRDWPDLMEHWRKSIRAIAVEIREGEAAVVFDDEKHLAYCEVKPLLRLAERQAQLASGGLY